MRLVDLEPEWLHHPAAGDPHSHQRVSTCAQANGILFLCPKCFQAAGAKREGVHSVICWDPSVSQDVGPKPGRWQLIGDTFDTLSLRAGSSSIALRGGCNAHFFIENGAIRMC